MATTRKQATTTSPSSPAPRPRTLTTANSRQKQSPASPASRPWTLATTSSRRKRPTMTMTTTSSSTSTSTTSTTTTTSKQTARIFVPRSSYVNASTFLATMAVTSSTTMTTPMITTVRTLATTIRRPIIDRKRKKPRLHVVASNKRRQHKRPKSSSRRPKPAKSSAASVLTTATSRRESSRRPATATTPTGKYMHLCCDEGRSLGSTTVYLPNFSFIVEPEWFASQPLLVSVPKTTELVKIVMTQQTDYNKLTTTNRPRALTIPKSKTNQAFLQTKLQHCKIEWCIHRAKWSNTIKMKLVNCAKSFSLPLLCIISLHLLHYLAYKKWKKLAFLGITSTESELKLMNEQKSILNSVW